jgi:Ca2+-transporting ATPase
LSYDRAAFTSTDEILAELGTRLDGLSSEEANARLRKYGPNVFPSGKRANVVERFVTQFKNLFNVLLLVASTLSFLAGWGYNDPGSIQMGLAILVVVILNAFFSLAQEYRAEKAVRAISRLVPQNAKVARSGQLTQVKVADIVPGDIVALEEGDRVPADMRLTSAFETSVDNSILTGESEPQRRFATMEPAPISNITDYHNIVLAGTTLVSGVARGVVLATGKDTQFGNIVSISRDIKEPLSRLEREISSAGKLNFLVAVLVGGIFFLVASMFVNLTVTESLLFAIGVMVSLVPEGFQLTVSLALALTASTMSKRNVVVKRLSSIETLGSATTLCVDKTGTITSGEMMVRRLWTNGEVFEVTGDGYSPRGFVKLGDRRVSKEERPHILSLFEVGAFCNNAKLNAPSDRIPRWTVLGDPTDGAFLVFSGKGDFNVEEALAKSPRLTLIPFDSSRAMMTSIHRTIDRGVVAYCKGAPHRILSKSSKILLDNQDVILNSEQRDAVRRQIDEFAAEGFRVLAMATRTLPGDGHQYSADIVEKDLTFLGLAALHDPPRPAIATTVAQARKAGMKVIMITGDHATTAEAIAKKTGIITSGNHNVVKGNELSDLSDDQLARLLERHEIVFARTSPEQKLRIVRALRSRGETVAVTGDGVNDSPALMEADVGVAMGAGGTDVARESADIVLLDNNFTSLVEGVRLGRAMFDNLRKFVTYVFTHNWAQLFAFLVFVFFQVPLPILVVQILAIDLGMDVWPSLGLVLEPPEQGVMDRPPRPARERLLDPKILFRALQVGLIIGVGSLMWVFHTWMGAGWSFGQTTVSDPQSYAKGTTLYVAGIMAGQLGNFLSIRAGAQSAFRTNQFRSKWPLVGVTLQIAVLTALIYVPFFQPFFNTVPISASDWLYLCGLGALVLITEEARKIMRRLVSKR